MSEGGDYEEAQLIEQGTKEVLIPAIKGMGETLQKVSQSVGAGARRVAADAEEVDGQATGFLHQAADDGLPQAERGAAGVSAKAESAGTTPAEGGAVDRDGSSGCNNVGEPVDVVSGQFVTAGIDVHLPGVLPLLVRRAYATAFPGGRLLGAGWSCTLDIRVEIGADGIVFVDDDCRILAFPVPGQPGEIAYSSAGPALALKWERVSDTIEIEDRDQGCFYEFTDLAASTDRRGTVTRPLTAIVDRNGNRVVILRDAGLPVEMAHSGGYRLAVDTVDTPAGFRLAGLRLLDTDGSGPDTDLLHYQYDPKGRLLGVVDSTGIPFCYDWDANDRIVAWIDRTGFEFTYTYDGVGRVVRTDGQDGYGSGAFSYDPERRVTVYTDSLGQPTSFFYDARERVTKVIDALGAETLADYDANGQVASLTDALGGCTRYTRDASGRLVRVERPDGTATIMEYGPHWRPIRINRPDGAVWQFEYDENANLTAQTDPCGAVTRFERGAHGAANAIIDAAGARTLIESNRAGLEIATTDPLGNRSVTRRDGFGRVVESVDPLGAATRYGWNIEGLALWRVLPDGFRQERRYDAQGALIEETDSLGAVTRFEIGPFSVPSARITPDGARLAFTYDTELRLTSVVNAASETWSYSYDAAGNLAAESDFGGRTLTYEHDALGQLTRRINGAGEAVDFLWDELGRVQSQQTADGAEVVFHYDDADRLVRAENSETVLELTYDALGHVLSDTVNGHEVTNAYDLLGRRVERRTPSGVATTWVHDANHQVAEMTAAGQRLAFGYDGAGRELYRWVGEGTAITSAWDANGRRTALQLVSVEGQAEAQASRLLHEQAWSYRDDGMPQSVRDTVAGDRTFDLDRLGRVTAVRAAEWSEQYAYDDAGRLASSVRSTERYTDTDTEPGNGTRVLAGALLRQAGRTSYEHDRQGRVTRVVRRTLSGTSKTWTFQYDSFDRLTEATNPEGEHWRYRYDPLGRRIAKQRLDSDGAVVEETRFAWDDETLIEQTHITSTEDMVTATVWEYEPDETTAVAQIERSYLASAPQDLIDERFYAIVSDPVGSPTALITTAGAVAWRTAADVWGAQGGTGGPGRPECPLRFPGQYHDRETGLHYNRHRYYDPRAARFTTPDPLGLAPAPDHYGYVDNPLDEIDPLGLAAKRKNTPSASTPTPAPTPAPVGRAATSPIAAPNTLPGFPNATKVRAKTPVQGGGGKRARWEDKKRIYEWDSQHGEVEVYDKQGNHIGAFDPNTGEPMTDSKGNVKGPVSGRKCVR